MIALIAPRQVRCPPQSVVRQNRNQRQFLKKIIVKKRSKAFLPMPIKRLMTSLQQSKLRIMWIKIGFKAPFAA
jgi:hypothetical protein